MENQSSDESENDFLDTSAEITETKASIEKLLPTKSAVLYENSYQKFIKWCNERNITIYSEDVLLEYFTDLAGKMKCSSLWPHYSMIRSVLVMRHDVNISEFLKLRAFLKKQAEGYIAKKSRVLTKDQINQFLDEAPDDKYLAAKVILIFGVFGACRCDELVKMTIDDVEDFDSLLFIKILGSKSCKPRSYTIVGDKYLTLYRKYASLRPTNYNERRLFLKYINGKCCRMVMGVHTIGNVAKNVASYLKLPNWTEYTGHCLRRTSATELVDNSEDITCLKKRKTWKSSSVAESITESLANVKDAAIRIVPSKPTEQSSSTICEPVTFLKTERHSSDESDNDNGFTTTVANNYNVDMTLGHQGLFQNTSFHNCTFNINLEKK